MAQDLTGFPLSDVYSTFLHTDTVVLSTGPLSIYSGKGEKTSLSLSTSSVVVTGGFILNNVTFPTTSGPVYSIPVMTSTNSLEFKSLNYVLTSVQAVPVPNGTYSSATITYANGLISSITNTGTTKLFFIDSRVATAPGPDNTQLLNSIAWNAPTQGDIAYILQKVMSGTTMVDLTVFKYVYNNSAGWQRTQIL